MPLKVVRRGSTGALTISGTVAGQRVQRRAQSNSPKLAEEEAAALEAEILRTDWHGERLGARSFAAAVTSYIKAKPRREDTKARLNRLLVALGDIKLSAIDQDTVTTLAGKMLRPGATPATVMRGVIIPLRSVLLHAHRRGWCDRMYFEAPETPAGRTLFMSPAEAHRLLDAAAPHLRPLLLFLLGTGARLSEALYLDWRDVDLTGGRAIFWPARTKSRRRRDPELSPRVVGALANLPHRDGMVFRRPDGEPYTEKDGEGGQIKRAWAGAIRRAGLDRGFTPHSCRHTWASWHYALHKDPLRLMEEGGWSSLDLVRRYAHLTPAGHEAAIRRFLACDQAVTDINSVQSSY